MIIAAMSDAVSEQRQRQPSHEEKHSFAHILKEEENRLDPEDRLEGRALTYARNGQLQMMQAARRSYN